MIPSFLLFQTENIKSEKPLPIERSTESFQLGYKESDRVPPGRVSLLQAINFISKHQSNPEEWTVEKIAEENKIQLDVASMQEMNSILQFQYIMLNILLFYLLR